MQIVETADMWVLRIRDRIRIPDIKASASHYAPIIEREMTDSGLAAEGPWFFVAHHLPRNSKDHFDWEICRPLKEKPSGYSGSVELCHFEPIIAASTIHQGSLRTLFTKGYATLVQEIENSRHVFSGESREIYHGWNGPGAAYQRIEIQFGLAR